MFDALNHLPDTDALSRCFTCVRRVLARGGYFIFDLNTRVGLRRWSTINVADETDAMVVARGLFDDTAGRAVTHVSGFLRDADGRYTRFEETVYNTAFELRCVESLLRAAGFTRVHFARAESLSEPVAEPETEARVFVVAAA